jgi:hypothetical protein
VLNVVHFFFVKLNDLEPLVALNYENHHRYECFNYRKHVDITRTWMEIAIAEESRGQQ